MFQNCNYEQSNNENVKTEGIDIKDTVYISARSVEGSDGINVQLVMERLGGGGHSTVAGAQVSNVSPAQAMDMVKQTIVTMQKEGAIEL